jgi:hypothetical protein
VQVCALYVYHIDTEKEGKAARGGGTALDGADTEVQAVVLVTKTERAPGVHARRTDR